jgi:hypothetical protein
MCPSLYNDEYLLTICIDCNDPCESKCARSAQPYLSACEDISNVNNNNVNNYCKNVTSMPNYLEIDRFDSFSLFSFTVVERGKSPDITHIEISTTTSTSLTIDAILSFYGSIYCGAFEESTRLLFIDDITVQNNYYFPSNIIDQEVSLSTSITIDNLNPSTTYNIYCYTVNLHSGSKSSSNMIISGFISGQTSCCKEIEIKLNHINIYQSDQSILNFIDINLDTSILNSQISLVISLIYDGLDVEIDSFSPNLISFYSSKNSSIPLSSSNPNEIITINSLISPSILINSAFNPGSYIVKIDQIGPSSSEYNVIFIDDINTFHVDIEGNIPVNPPNVYINAYYSDTADVINIKFDSPTNQGNLSKSFQCDILFDFINDLNSKCIWVDDTLISIFPYLSDSNQFDIGNSIIINGGIISNKCNENCNLYPRTSTTNLIISLPIHPISPNIIISSANSIGRCMDLLIDLSLSRGYCGRSWLSLSFHIESSASESINLNIKNYLNSLTTTYNDDIIIPRDLLEYGHLYNIIINSCNFFNQCSSSSKTISVIDNITPFINILGDNIKTKSVKDKIIIQANGYFPSCDADTTNNIINNLKYVWKIYDNQEMELFDIMSISKDQSKYILHPYSLKSNQYYIIKAIIYYISPSLGPSQSAPSSYTTTKLFVQPGELILSLTDLSSIYNLEELNSIFIDASDSYDEDKLINNANYNNNDLIFKWFCVVIEPIYINKCENLIFSIGFSNLIIELKSNSSSDINTIYSINLILTEDAISPRLAQTTIFVRITPSNSPLIQLSIINNNYLVLKDNHIKINTKDKLKLNGLITLSQYPYRGNINWKVDDKNINLQSTVLTPILQPVYDLLSSSRLNDTNGGKVSFFVNFVLKSDILIELSTYSFSLTCTLENGLASLSTIIITTNGKYIKIILFLIIFM